MYMKDEKVFIVNENLFTFHIFEEKKRCKKVLN